MPSKPIALAALPVLLLACPPPSPRSDASTDVVIHDTMPINGCATADATTPTFCSLGTDITGATVPTGFCLRRYAVVPEARTLSFAPNGDLFVGAPGQPTRGGASGGMGAVLVLSDDNHDGAADLTVFASGMVDVHGVAYGSDGYVYFTTGPAVWRTPYVLGQRTERPGMREMLATYAVDANAGFRETHGLARSAGGTLYTSQGVDSALSCPNTPRAGTIGTVASGAITTVAQGFRNPLYLRCHFRDEVCIASELGDDGIPSEGAHEKLVVLGTGTQYGFPCCTTTGHTTHFDNDAQFDCSQAATEQATFALNDTPFGLDWERGCWPAPYAGGLFVALHGSFYNPWQNAGVVFAPTDPATHTPSGAFTPFVTGFGPGGSELERPADVAFAPDGRLFFADDHSGAVYWVAPVGLHMPAY